MTKGNDHSTFYSMNHSSAGQTTLIGMRVASRPNDRELRVFYLGPVVRIELLRAGKLTSPHGDRTNPCGAEIDRIMGNEVGLPSCEE